MSRDISAIVEYNHILMNRGDGSGLIESFGLDRKLPKISRDIEKARPARKVRGSFRAKAY